MLILWVTQLDWNDDLLAEIGLPLYHKMAIENNDNKYVPQQTTDETRAHTFPNLNRSRMTTQFTSKLFECAISVSITVSLCWHCNTGIYWAYSRVLEYRWTLQGYCTNIKHQIASIMVTCWDVLSISTWTGYWGKIIWLKLYTTGPSHKAISSTVRD